MKIIIGLGNPEKKYFNTYHNIGFSCIDLLAQKLNIKVSKKMCNSLVGEGKIKSEKVILAKPLTYMNLSGEAANALMKKFKCQPKDIVVFCDDIDTPLGKFRYRENGSGGTHNGLKNIVEKLASKDFKRIKVGINKPEGDIADYVLSEISTENAKILCDVIDQATNSIEKVL